MIRENIRAILNFIHPDKNPDAPAHISKYCPLIAFVKGILVNDVNLQVYKCCDMGGITRCQEGLCACRRCDPFLIDLWDWETRVYGGVAKYTGGSTMNL